MWRKITILMLTLVMFTGVTSAREIGKQKTVTYEGELQKLVLDNFKTGEATVQTLLRLDSGKVLHLHGAEEFEVTSGRVTITGTRMNRDNIAVSAIQPSSMHRSSGSNLDSGPQNALVVLTKYAGHATPSFGLTETGLIIDEVDAFWSEDSFNKFSLVPSYVDWTEIVKPANPNLSSIYPLVVEAVDPSVDFSQVDMLIIIGDMQFTTFAGQAFFEPTTVNTDEGPKDMRLLVNDSGLTLLTGQLENIVKHEVTHTVNLGHAFFLNCGNESLALEGCAPGGGDITNVMRPNATSQPAHHTHAQQKLQAEYIDESQITTVTQTGVYTIDPLALPPGPGTRALRLGQQSELPLWIEYRQPIGMDVGMDNAPAGETSTIYDGALITKPTSSSQKESYLIDADFTQGDPFDGVYLTLLPGETLEDPFSGASITTLSATPSALTVAVEIDCIDNDDDGYGINCLAGDDCDDNDPNITTSGPANVQIPTGEYLNFGDVITGNVSYQLLEIKNDGCEQLAILGMNSPDPNFVLLTSGFFGVPAKSSVFVAVQFTPGGLGPDRSDILMQTSDPDEQWVTAIAIANVVTPPELDFSPGSFSVTLPTGGSVTETLTIDNQGGAALNYWIQNHNSVGWLDISQEDELASIPGYGSNQVELDFNADGQCSASGSVQLRLLANDTDESESFIPVSWSVYAAPDVTYNRNPSDVIEFQNPGQSQTIVIDNDGCLPLTINSITSSFPATYVAPFSGPITLQPGESYTQNINFVGCPRRGGIAQCGSAISISTDDPDEAVTDFLTFGQGFAP